MTGRLGDGAGTASRGADGPALSPSASGSAHPTVVPEPERARLLHVDFRGIPPRQVWCGGGWWDIEWHWMTGATCGRCAAEITNRMSRKPDTTAGAPS